MTTLFTTTTDRTTVKYPTGLTGTSRPLASWPTSVVDGINSCARTAATVLEYATGTTSYIQNPTVITRFWVSGDGTRFWVSTDGTRFWTS